jgi:hypothetical protein
MHVHCEGFVLVLVVLVLGLLWMRVSLTRWNYICLLTIWSAWWGCVLLREASPMRKKKGSRSGPEGENVFSPEERKNED